MPWGLPVGILGQRKTFVHSLSILVFRMKVGWSQHLILAFVALVWTDSRFFLDSELTRKVSKLLAIAVYSPVRVLEPWRFNWNLILGLGLCPWRPPTFSTALFPSVFLSVSSRKWILLVVLLGDIGHVTKLTKMTDSDVSLKGHEHGRVHRAHHGHVSDGHHPRHQSPVDTIGVKVP